MIKKISNLIKNYVSYGMKPNSFMHQSTLDIVYDADKNKFINVIWKLINLINFFLSKILTIFIILYESLNIKKINNSNFFKKDNSKNKRCFIFGSAPSLNTFDVNKVSDNDKTFVCNSFYLSQISDKLRADYYTILNTGWMKFIDLHSNEDQLNLDKVFFKLGNKYSNTNFVFGNNYIKDYKKYIEKNLNFYSYFNISSISPINYFPKTINYNSVIPHPVDVTQFNLILAYALGFKEIFLISVEQPFEKDLIEGYKKASDISENFKENLSFKPKAYLNKNSKLNKEFSKEHNLESEQLYFNHAWWHWFRGYNYYHLYEIFKSNNVNIYRAEDNGTLNFIPVKKI